MWLNKKGIANFLSISQLKEGRYKIEYLTGWHWVVHIPKGFTYHFKKDTGVCKGMPFVDMMAPSSSYICCHDNEQSFKFADEMVVMVQTVHGNMEGYTMNPVKKAALFHSIQVIIGHLTDN